MAKSRSNKDKNRILFFLVVASIVGLFFLANAGYIKIPGFQAVLNPGESYCYQESANIATDCGGLETGVYGWTGGWSIGLNSVQNIFDGNWSSWANYQSTANPKLYINYSKPSDALQSSLLQYKVEGKVIVNLTIDSNCWAQETLQFMHEGNTSPGGYRSTLSCFDGYSWIVLRNIIGNFERPYEEAMWWVISTSPQSGCQYNNPSCESNHDCIDNICILKNGCQYSNPTCDVNYNCLNNSCVLKYGCAYFNPKCSSDENCEDNVCIQKTVSVQQTTASETQLPEEELGAQIIEEERAATETSLFQTKYLFIGIVAAITIVLLISINVIKPKKMFKR